MNVWLVWTKYEKQNKNNVPLWMEYKTRFEIQKKSNVYKNRYLKKAGVYIDRRIV